MFRKGQTYAPRAQINLLIIFPLSPRFPLSLPTQNRDDDDLSLPEIV